MKRISILFRSLFLILWLSVLLITGCATTNPVLNKSYEINSYEKAWGCAISTATQLGLTIINSSKESGTIFGQKSTDDVSISLIRTSSGVTLTVNRQSNSLGMISSGNWPDEYASSFGSCISTNIAQEQKQEQKSEQKPEQEIRAEVAQKSEDQNGDISVILYTVKKKTRLMSEPRTKSKVISKLRKGHKVEQIQIKGKWIKVKSEKDEVGWVPAKDLTACSSKKKAASGKDFSSEGQVWLPDGNKLIQVNSVEGYREMPYGQAIRASFTLQRGYYIFAHGTKAKIRLNTSPAVIYTRHAPSEIGVALFTVEENRRSIWVEQAVGSNQAIISPEENEMKFDEETIGENIHKLTFKKPLKPGEYGFITPGGDTNYLIYDFAIEQ